MQERKLEAKRAFIVGYLHGRSSLGNHDPAGKDADAAFEKWWSERFQKGSSR